MKPKKKKKKKPKALIPKGDAADGENAGGDDEETAKGKGEHSVGPKIKKGSATIGKDSWPPDDLMN